MMRDFYTYYATVGATLFGTLTSYTTGCVTQHKQGSEVYYLVVGTTLAAGSYMFEIMMLLVSI